MTIVYEVGYLWNIMDYHTIAVFTSEEAANLAKKDLDKALGTEEDKYGLISGGMLIKRVVDDNVGREAVKNFIKSRGV